MADLLVLDGFSPLPQGPTLSLSLASGKSLCILGPAGGGKTRFLRTALGLERIGQGRATSNSPVSHAGDAGWPRRATPLSVARRGAGSKRANLAGEALYATGLWDCQNTSVDQLSRTQRGLAELLSCLSCETGLMVVDGQFDSLDPWSFRKVMEAFRKRLNVGYGLIAVTNRPELAVHFDHLVVMQSSGVRFVGTVEELLRLHGEAVIEVETQNQSGVRALVAPFEISIAETDRGVVLRAAEGQQLAARLLSEGYGDIKMVVLKEPTVESALEELLR
ncbi:MAG: hypothetical protein ABL949_15720 [Fimbriimonadaceae bacterium]